MEGTSNKNRSKSSEGLLKTTTWGTLIALSLLAAAWGFSGGSSRVHDDSTTPELLAQLESPQTPGTLGNPQTARQISSPNDIQKQSSSFRPFSSDRGTSKAATATFPPANGVATLSASLVNAPRTPESLAKNQSQDASLPGASEDPQVLIARKIAPDLKGINPDKPVDVIVQFRHPPMPTELSEVGAATKAELPLLNARLVTVKAGDIASLATHSNVAYVSPDRKLRGALDHVVSAVNADLAYANGWNGTGIGVAVLDSGVNSIYDLNSDGNTNPSRIVYSQSFVANDTNTSDGYGHGTHVSGIIAGNGYDSQYAQTYPGVYRGIAPEAKIINLRVLDGTGAGTDSAVISAIQTAINLKSTYNIRVMNLSLARGVYEGYALDPLCQAVESAWRAGIFVVVAAGNMGEYNGAGTSGYG